MTLEHLLKDKIKLPEQNDFTAIAGDIIARTNASSAGTGVYIVCRMDGRLTKSGIAQMALITSDGWIMPISLFDGIISDDSKVICRPSIWRKL